MADLRDLIERVEKLKDPDRFTDEMIWEAVGGWPAPEYRSVDYMRVFGTPLTGSLDAAIGLIGVLLPGWTWNVGGCPPDFLTDKDKPFGADLIGPVSWKVIDQYVGEEPVFDTVSAQHSSPAIALCLATLRALAKEGR